MRSVIHFPSNSAEAENQGGDAAAGFLTLQVLLFPEGGLDHFGAADESLAGFRLEALTPHESAQLNFQLLVTLAGWPGLFQAGGRRPKKLCDTPD